MTALSERQEALYQLRTKVFAKPDGTPIMQKDMAALIGVDIGTLNRWESGRQMPNDMALEALIGRLAVRASRRDGVTKRKFDEALVVVAGVLS